MTQRDWEGHDARVLSVFLNGQEIADRTPRGESIVDDCFLVLFNAHHEEVVFTMPARRFGRGWAHELCTFEPELAPGARRHAARAAVAVPARSVRLLRRD